MADSAQDIETYPPPYMAVDEPKGYGLSGKIMLSAIVILFAVVVIMVCLHVYARWYILRSRRRQIRRARRRTHLVFYIEPNDPSNIVPIPARGLDASVLKSLPTFTYTEKGFEVEVKMKEEERETKNEGEKEEEPMVPECAVCLSEFEEGERGRLLPKCNHKFHVECIDMWFHSHSTCPICRSDVDAGESVVSGMDTPAPAEVGGENGDVVVELTESTQSQLGGATESAEVVVAPGPSRATAVGGSSFGGRRKGSDMVGVSIEVPPRRSQSFSFTNSDESGPSPSPSYKSPTTSRILSLKRILSRDKKSPLPSPSGAGSSCYRPVGSAPELDLELGRVDESTQSLTPR